MGVPLPDAMRTKLEYLSSTESIWDAEVVFREAESVDSLGLTHPIPSSALPPEDWFSIDSIVADLRLTTLARRERVLTGYFERVLAGYFVDSKAFEW